MAEAAPVSAQDRAGAAVFAYIYRGGDEHKVCYSFHHSMIQLMGWEMYPDHQPRVMIGGFIAHKGGTDALADARNKVVQIFLAENQADWLFWVDTDMGFAPDTLDRLMEAADPGQRPIVGGLAFTWREDHADGMGGWRCSPVPTIFDWRALSTGEMGYEVRLNYSRDTLTQCAGTGSACVLIHRGVFEKIRDVYGEHWYDRVRNPYLGKMTSEDLSFCVRAGALKIPVYVHTGVKTTHQKNIWVAEEDYITARFLDDQRAEAAPDATEETAVIVPVLGRPGSAAPFMESLAASGAPLARVYAVADADDTDTAAAWKEAGATVLTWHGPPPGTFAQKANIGYRHTAEPWLLLAGDDVKFHPGWLDQAQHAARDGADVVGTNDLHNPRVTAGEHSPHLLIRRAYADEQGASWDGPGTVAHEGYRHWFVDDEIVTAAKQRGAWVMAFHSKVEHLHPLWGLAPDDATYQLGQSHAEADREVFGQRCQVNL